MREKFSLVIPTYNEAKNIENLCTKILKILSEHNINFELIIVDDDSPDGTWKIVENLTKENKAIKLIRRINEKDLSTAVIRGWGESEGDILGVIDGDFQHPPEIIPFMIRKMLEDSEVDIVVASRHGSGGRISKRNAWRRSVSWLGVLVSAFFLPEILEKVRDPMSGYFILRKKVISGKSLDPIGYKVLLEVLAKGTYKKVIEAPYFFKEREKGSSKAGLREYLNTSIHIWKLSFHTGEIYRVTKYICVGISGALVTLLGYLFGRWLNFGQAFSYALGLELAIINNFILNEFWTFSDKSRNDPMFRSRIMRLFEFNFICIYGFLISFLSFLVSLKIMHLISIYAALIGVSIGFIWNFLIGTNVTWLSKIFSKNTN